ncbi:13165_t:CDS:1, partial [Acaulospora morrowiae]
MSVTDHSLPQPPLYPSAAQEGNSDNPFTTRRQIDEEQNGRPGNSSEQEEI